MEFISSIFDYLAEGISKQTVDGQDNFFFMLIIKYDRKEIGWQKNCYIKKEFGMD